MTTATCYQTTELDIRTKILLNYIVQWSNLFMSKFNAQGLKEPILLADLCAGLGIINSQTSTLSKILEFVVNHPALKNGLTCIVNDKNMDAIATITNSIRSIDAIETLAIAPQLHCSELDNNLLNLLHYHKNSPSLVLLDYWNYEAIDLDFTRKLVNDHGADCLVYVDYKALLKAIPKKKKEKDLFRFFGKKGTQELSSAFNNKYSPYQKEQLILTAFREALQKKLGKNSLSPLQYKFYDETNKTSHFLFFITQNESAYSLMREVLLVESQIIEDGIGNLEFNPNLGIQRHSTSQTLFGAMFQLEQELLKTYKAQTLQLIDIYENHHRGKTLVKQNYIDALLNLEKKDKITITRKRLSRLHVIKENTLEDKMFISFNKE